MEELSLVDSSARGRRWRVQIYPERILFQPEEGPPTSVTREEAAAKLELVDSALLAKTLVAQLQRSVVFRLDGQTFERLERWFGPATRADLVAALKRRLRWIFPIALIFVVGSLPIGGDPESGIEAVPFDAVTFSLGIGLLVLALLVRFRPDRRLFLLDAVWFLALAADAVVDVVHGSHPLWLGFAAAVLVFAFGGLEQYRRFAPEKMASGGESGGPIEPA